MNLDILSRPLAGFPDYPVRDPENAWPGASAEIVVNMHVIGDIIVQIGRDAAGGDVWHRIRRGGDGWLGWRLGPGPAPLPPPEPEPERPEAEASDGA